MAKTGKIGGEYVSQAVLTCTESAINTLTFAKLESGLAPLERIGWVIQRVDFKVTSSSLLAFNASGDLLRFALTVSGSLTALNDNDPAIVALKSLARIDIGAAATGMYIDNTFSYDYSQLMGGGLLTLPTPLYLGVVGSSLTAVATVTARIYFYPIEMSTDDYFNLVQSRQILINS